MADGYSPSPNSVVGALSVTGDINDSGGNINVTGGGKFVTANVRSLTAMVQVQETGGVGNVQLSQAAGVSANPGAGQIRIEVIPGTTGSKLVVLSSTGAVYTVLDNIV